MLYVVWHRDAVPPDAQALIVPPYKNMQSSGHSKTKHHITFVRMHLCEHECVCTSARAWVWRSEENLWELVFSFCHVGPEDWTRISYQTWQQAPLPDAPSYGLPSTFWYKAGTGRHGYMYKGSAWYMVWVGYLLLFFSLGFVFYYLFIYWIFEFQVQEM